MKATRLICTLLFLLLNSAALQLPAQQNQSDRKKLEEIKAKADKGDAQAQFDLGVAFAFGSLGLTNDEAEAVNWYRKAAEQNFALAQLNLGNCYADGEGVAKDEVEAAKWFRKAAEQNFAPAQYNLGACYDTGDGVVKNEVEAAKWYRKAADQKMAQAQYSLGHCYAHGQGVSQDSNEAVRWFRKAAEQNYAEAQYSLGNRYLTGDGVAKDDVEAVKWFRKAANQGLAISQFILSLCYAKGEIVNKDYGEAMKWCRKAAEQNYVHAQYKLGLIYESGHEGVTADLVEAVKWYRKAAEQNHPVAQYDLGLCYATGGGLTKNDVEAVKWFRKAAEQNYAQAQYRLGLYYGAGEGIAKDYVEAYKWLLLAAAQGDEDAKKFIPKSENMITREQIAEGQKLARNFKPRQSNFGDSVSGRDVADLSPAASGTGFFITEDGFLITNEHVVKDAAQVRLVTSAGIISAKVVKVDAANDVALLKAEGKFSPLPIAASRAVRLGNSVATVGFPNIGLQGFAPKFARGEIAALSGAGDDARYFQISVPVQPGNSGGALVDERGNVVGVVSAKLNAQAALLSSGSLPENVNYAVKSSYLLSFLESVPELLAEGHNAKLKEPNTKERKFDDVVSDAEKAAVLVVVY